MEAGTPVRVEMTKWGDRPHWQFDARHLGSDEHGDWFGIPTGTRQERPGAVFVNRTDMLGLVPRRGAWLAAFHAPGFEAVVYVDMTTVPVWEGTVLRAVDLDLDVVKTATGEVYVDDEDEFAEHQVAFGYPPEVVELAARTSREVLAAVTAGDEPFGTHAERWFEALRGLGA